MSLASAKGMLLDASAGGWAVGAFNVTSLPQMQGVVEAAVERKAPLILQTSVSPSKSMGQDLLVALYRALAASAPVPVSIQLDHCADAGWCVSCAEAGYTSVMIDASRLPFDENVRQTREVCLRVHALGDVSVEGELGTVSQWHGDPLRAGMVIMVDPMIWLENVPHTYVRVEDKVLITEDGCEQLTASSSLELAEVEALMTTPTRFPT